MLRGLPAAFKEMRGEMREGEDRVQASVAIVERLCWRCFYLAK